MVCSLLLPVIKGGCTYLVKVAGIRDLAALYRPDIYVTHRTMIAELTGGTLNNPTLFLQKERPPGKIPWSKWGNRLDDFQLSVAVNKIK